MKRSSFLVASLVAGSFAYSGGAAAQADSVEAGEKLGFLPGDMVEKVDPYLRPMYDALFDLVDSDRANRLLDKGIIEVAPIAFMRGRTLADAFVILDEAQNTTQMQMKMFLKDFKRYLINLYPSLNLEICVFP